MPIKNFYDAVDVVPGDVFLVTLKVTVQYNRTYRVYRCPFNARIGEDGTPQGDRLHGSTKEIKAAMETIMPILRIAEGPDPSA